MKSAVAVPIPPLATTRKLRLENLLVLSGLVSVLVIAAFLRFNNLATNPGWYSDEGSDLDIARTLMAGRFQYLAIGGTPLVAGRVPLMHALFIIGFLFRGYDIATARLIVGIFSVATIFLLFWIVRRMLGQGLALLAAFVLMILPNAVFYDRIAFGYDLQAPFVLLCWWGLWEFLAAPRRRWLLLAALAAAVAYMIELTGLPLVVVVVLVTLLYQPRSLLWALPLMLAPGLSYLGVLFISAPNALQQDLALTFSRSSDSFVGQFFNLMSNYTIWFDWTPWVVIGIAGLFLIKPRRARLLALLMFFGILFNVMRMFPGGFDLSYHRYLGVLPFVALGAAQFIACAYRLLVSQFADDWGALQFPAWPHLALPTRVQRSVSGIVVFLVLLTPLIWTTGWDYYLTASTEAPLPTALDPVLARKPSDAIAVTDFLNAQLRSADVVVSSPTIAWRIRGQVTDFQQALAYDGIMTDNYGPGLPHDRFFFDASFNHATFVVVDNVWRNWAVKVMPPLSKYMAMVESWPRVMHRGDFDVYRNPAR